MTVSNLPPLPTSHAPGQRAVCAKCRHIRTRAKIDLFDAQDLQSPGALKAQTQWDQDMKQRAQLELQRLQARQLFEYEPHNYAWCAKYTRIDLIDSERQRSLQEIDEQAEALEAQLADLRSFVHTPKEERGTNSAASDAAQGEPLQINTEVASLESEIHMLAENRARLVALFEIAIQAQAGDAAAIEQLMSGDGVNMNPVTGEIGPLFHLCALHNENGDCEDYEPKRSKQ